MNETKRECDEDLQVHFTHFLHLYVFSSRLMDGIYSFNVVNINFNAQHGSIKRIGYTITIKCEKMNDLF